MEAVNLRIQDINFDYLSINIWRGKGGKHRSFTLAPELIAKVNLFTSKICNESISKAFIYNISYRRISSFKTKQTQ